MTVSLGRARALAWPLGIAALAASVVAFALTAALTTGYALLGGALALALPHRVRVSRPGPLATQSPRAR